MVLDRESMPVHRRRALTPLTTALVLALFACGGEPPTSAPQLREASLNLAGERGNADDDEDAPGPVYQYPGQFPSLQDAVDAAPRGATIQIAAGRYYEQVHVFGKRLTLAGAGRGQTTFDGSNLSGALVVIGGSANLTLRDLSLSSAADALVGGGPNGGTPPSLRATRVGVDHAVRGIGGTFSRLVLNDVVLRGIAFAPLDVIDTPISVFRHLTADATGSTGSIIYNTHKPAPVCAIRITDSEFIGGELGGLMVVGGACPVFMQDVRVHDAAIAGIGLFNVSGGRLLRTTVERTRADATGRWGDGIIVWGTVMDIFDPTLSDNAREGLTEFGCDVAGAISSVRLSGGSFSCNRGGDIDVEQADLDKGGAPCGPGSATLNDEGLNTCLACGSTTPTHCVAQSSRIDPPATPPER